MSAALTMTTTARDHAENTLELIPNTSTKSGRDWKFLKTCNILVRNNPGLLKAAALLLMAGTAVATNVYTLTCNVAHSESSYANHRTISVFPVATYSIEITDETQDLVQTIQTSLRESKFAPTLACAYIDTLTGFTGNISSLDILNMTVLTSAAAGDIVSLVVLVSSVAIVLLCS